MIRLVLALALLVAALLVVVPPPFQLAWLLQVGVTEWGWAFAAAALVLLLVPGWWRSGKGRLAAALLVVAGGLFLSPLQGARRVAATLSAELATAFGPTGPPPEAGTHGPLREPFDLGTLVGGIEVPEVAVTTHRYTSRDLPLELDLYHPPRSPGSALLPTVVALHGGAWRTGDRLDVARTSRYLASRGYVVAAVDYRLAPQSPWPAARDDVLEAMHWLDQSAEETRVDTRRLVLVGWSAGGQLALQVAYSGRHPGVQGVVAFYPPTDLPYGWEHPADPDVIDTRAVLMDFLGGTPEERRERYLDASPIQHVGPGTVRTLLVHGARDPVVQPVQSLRLAERLEAADRPVHLLWLPWATHGCDYNLAGPCGQLTTFALERFLATAFRTGRGRPGPAPFTAPR